MASRTEADAEGARLELGAQADGEQRTGTAAATCSSRSGDEHETHTTHATDAERHAAMATDAGHAVDARHWRLAAAYYIKKG